MFAKIGDGGCCRGVGGSLGGFFFKSIGEGGLRVGSLRGVVMGGVFWGGRLGLWGLWGVVRTFE